MKSTDKYFKKDIFSSDSQDWSGDGHRNRARFDKRTAKRYKVYDDLVEEFDDGEHLGRTQDNAALNSERSEQFRRQAELKEASFYGHTSQS